MTIVQNGLRRLLLVAGPALLIHGDCVSSAYSLIEMLCGIGITAVCALALISAEVRRRAQIVEGKDDQQLLDMFGSPGAQTREDLAAALSEIRARGLMSERQTAFAAVVRAAEPAAVMAQPKVAYTLKIAVETRSGVRVYCGDAEDRLSPYAVGVAIDQGVVPLRADILQYDIPKDSETAIEEEADGGASKTWKGRLIRCAARYPALADLYAPVRRSARSGLEYAAFAGALLGIALLGCRTSGTDPAFGGALAALLFGLIVLWISFRMRVRTPEVVCAASVLYCAIVFPIYAAVTGVYPILIAVAAIGGLLTSMPGMAIGAIVGVIRRRALPRAFDAPEENVVAEIAVPLVLTAAMAVACHHVAQSHHHLSVEPWATIVRGFR